MKLHACILCNNTETVFIENIKKTDLNKAYLRYLQCKTGYPETGLISYWKCNNCSLHFFDPTAAGEEELYLQLNKHPWYYMAEKPEYALAAAHLPKQGAILEVGSGNAAFAKFCGTERYTGIEFNDAAIALAKTQNISLIKESIEIHAEKNKGKYQCVINFQVLEHVKNPAIFIQKCLEALAPGGTLIISVPNHSGICGNSQNNLLDMPPHHISHWSEKTMHYIGKKFKLKIISIETENIAPYHQEWAASLYHDRRMRNFFRLKNTLLDFSLQSRIISKIARHMGKISKRKLLTNKGHAMITCYQKE